MNQAAVDMFWLGSLSELEVAGQQRHHVGLRLWSAEAVDWSQPTHTSDSQFNSRWESSMQLCSHSRFSRDGSGSFSFF